MGRGASVVTLERVEEQGSPALYRATLPNGLALVVDSRPARRTVYCEIGVRAGSRDEPLELGGISHVLEHLLFKEGEGPGARKNPAFSRIRAAGGIVNAMTSFERTNYFCDVAADAFDEGWRGLASMVAGTRFTPRDLEIERNVVLEEAARNKNNPLVVAGYSVLRRVFPGDPLSQPIIGYRKTLEKIRYEDVRSYYERFYRPSNAYALIVGAVDPHAAADLVAATLGGWKGSGSPAPFPPLPRIAPERTFEFHTLIEQFYDVLGVQTPGFRAQDRVALELLRRVIGEGKTSRLYRRLVEQEGMTSDFLAQSFDLSNLGVFGVGGAVDPNRAERFRGILREEFRRIAREPVSPDELDLARRLLAADLTRDFETNDGIAEFRADRIVYGLPLSRDPDLDAAARLTPGDLLEVARVEFAPEKWREIQIAPARGFGKVLAVVRFLIFRSI